MSDEWFDVVNARDEVIDRALRRDVHARGLWHRAVHILVFDAASRVFLQQRSMTKDLSPGLWDSSCSGHVDAGEDYDRAATRELGEELGIPPERAARRERWFRVEPSVTTGWEFVWVYRLEDDGPFTLHPEEISGGEWLRPEAITARIAETPERYSPSFQLIWSLALALGLTPRSE